MSDKERAPKKRPTSKQTPQSSESSGPKKKRPPVQNPSKCTPLARERILGALRLGASFQGAAAAGGIGASTFNLWRNEDSAFAEECEQARGVMELRYLQRIDQAAAAHWQAGAWILERRRPEEYGRRFQPIVMETGDQPQGDEPGKIYRIAIEPIKGEH